MNIEDLTPRQRQMAAEIGQYLFDKYATGSVRSYIDAAKAVEFVSAMFQVDIKQAEADLNG